MNAISDPDDFTNIYADSTGLPDNPAYGSHELTQPSYMECDFCHTTFPTNPETGSPVTRTPYTCDDCGGYLEALDYTDLENWYGDEREYRFPESAGIEHYLP